MCGIIGIVDSKKTSKFDIRKLNSMQHHRGPDESGIFENTSIGLSMAMTRLSIVDIGNAHQPYTSKDGFVIIFNGEIFNAIDLFKEFKKDFKYSHSHVHELEVIYALYKKYGEKFLNKLNGMFAIAIYDPIKNYLFIARDRFGIKPLYYGVKNNIFSFSSEIKPLTKIFGNTVNINSASNYFELGFVSGKDTIFSNINSLLPGCSLRYGISNNNYLIKKWYKPNHIINNKLSDGEWNEVIYSQLSESVKKWSLSDVPICYLLSGGLDSSALVALASINSSNSVRTYSLGFNNNNESKWNELDIAKDVSKKYNTDHTEIILNSNDLADSLDDITHYIEQPYGGGLPSWAVFKKISENYKVAITGTGGDEIFGNYNRGAFISALDRTRIDNKLLKKMIENTFFLASRRQYSDILRFSEINKKPCTGLSNIENLLHLYNSYKFDSIDDSIAQLSIDSELTDDFLMMTDRFSMAHSVECRTPYLDHDLVNLLFSMPEDKKIKYHDYKSSLKSSVGHLLPKSVIDADKHGFNIPLSLWMRGRLRELTEDLLGVSALQNSNFIKPEFYNLYVKPMLDGNNSNIEIIWSCLMFQLWERGLKC
jgi:asparagine synthase (glutamine-hydrolysing)